MGGNILRCLMRYFKRIDSNGKTTTVESYSHDKPIPDAVEIEKAEHDSFIAALPAPVIIPPRDLIKEFDNLKATLKAKGFIE